MDHPDNTPKISVAISTYNRAGYLAQTLESLRRQTVPPFEILIQNDGSSDDTPGVVRRSGLPIRLYTWENHGLAASRNHLLTLAEGSWILFLDDDDLLDEHALEIFAGELRKDPRERILYATYQRIDSEGRPLATRDKLARLPQGDAVGELFLKNFLLPSATLLPVAALRELPVQFPEKQLAEDYDCFLRLALNIPVQGIERRLAFRRRHRSNMSSGNGSRGTGDQIRTLERFLALAGERIPEPVRRKRMAEMYARLALALTREKAPKKAIREAWRQSLSSRFVLKNAIRSLLALWA